MGNVIDWMAALHLYRYAELFRENKVTGRDLQTMDEDKLRVSLYVCLSVCLSVPLPFMGKPVTTMFVSMSRPLSRPICPSAHPVCPSSCLLVFYVIDMLICIPAGVSVLLC